ncbi:unnamed protein product [Bursaphelenchus okinawaensis]|uniref:Uncharacterized protein n=1 Tax=Bursaphelenchus okinawaensis TaxID=465554 RepID=A0A811L7P4_9BILA|nr:unnamed protein product [Bursaphelenchus okinawaensis]CAG9119697.1 unnamed protein product [Bursaphelenchus okinawaensis]
MSSPPEGLVLYVSDYEGRKYVGIFWREYCTRQLDVFLDERTVTFAKPGNYVYLHTTRGFEKMASEYILEPDLLRLESCQKTLENIKTDKGIQQVKFKDKVYFAKNDSESPLFGSVDIAEVGYSSIFGWVCLIKKYADPNVIIDYERAYNVIIARPPKKLAQSLVDSLGGYMFCMKVMDPIEDASVYRFMNEVAPFRREFANIVGERYFAEEMPVAIHSDDDIEGFLTFVFVFEHVSEDSYKAYDTTGKKIIRIFPNKKLDIGKLYVVDYSTDGSKQFEYYEAEQANRLLHKLGDTYEFEVEGKIQVFPEVEGGESWKAFIYTVFGTALLFNIPENYDEHVQYTIRAVFAVGSSDSYVWFCHRFCKINEDVFVKEKVFTKDVSTMLKRYNTKSELPERPNRSFLCPEAEVVENQVESDKTFDNEAKVLESTLGRDEAGSKKQVEEFKEEPAKEKGEEDKKEHYEESKEDVCVVSTNELIEKSSNQQKEAKELPETEKSFMPSKELVDSMLDADQDFSNLTDDSFINEKFTTTEFFDIDTARKFEVDSVVYNCKQETVTMVVCVLEARNGYVLTCTADQKYGCVCTEKFSLNAILVGQWVVVYGNEVVSPQGEFDFIFPGFEELVNPPLETVTINGPKGSMLLFKTKMRSSALTGDISNVNLLEDQGEVSYLRYNGNKTWSLFNIEAKEFDYDGPKANQLLQNEHLETCDDVGQLVEEAGNDGIGDRVVFEGNLLDDENQKRLNSAFVLGNEFEQNATEYNPDETYNDDSNPHVEYSLDCDDYGSDDLTFEESNLANQTFVTTKGQDTHGTETSKEDEKKDNEEAPEGRKDAKPDLEEEKAHNTFTSDAKKEDMRASPEVFYKNTTQTESVGKPTENVRLAKPAPASQVVPDRIKDVVLEEELLNADGELEDDGSELNEEIEVMNTNEEVSRVDDFFIPEPAVTEVLNENVKEDDLQELKRDSKPATWDDDETDFATSTDAKKSGEDVEQVEQDVMPIGDVGQQFSFPTKSLLKPQFTTTYQEYLYQRAFIDQTGSGGEPDSEDGFSSDDEDLLAFVAKGRSFSS